MKKLIILIAVLTSVTPGMSQDYYFPTVKGARLTYKHYDARGNQMKDQNRKPMWTTFTVEDVWPSANGDMVINVLIENQHTAGINRSVYEGAYIDNMIYGDVKIEGDSVMLDNMHGLLLKAYGGVPKINKDIESVKIKLDAIVTFPCKLEVGLELPDRMAMNANITNYNTPALTEMYKEQLRAIYEASGLPFAAIPNVSNNHSSVNALMKNRRVEKQEMVETNAGDFECFKITYDLEETNNGFTSQTAYAEWISPKIGLVKKEEYVRKGKVESLMILDSYAE